MKQCRVCGGIYQPIDADGFDYFHACPPGSALALAADRVVPDALAARLQFAMVPLDNARNEALRPDNNADDIAEAIPLTTQAVRDLIKALPVKGKAVIP